MESGFAAAGSALARAWAGRLAGPAAGWVLAAVRPASDCGPRQTSPRGGLWGWLPRMRAVSWPPASITKQGILLTWYFPAEFPVSVKIEFSDAIAFRNQLVDDGLHTAARFAPARGEIDRTGCSTPARSGPEPRSPRAIRSSSISFAGPFSRGLLDTRPARRQAGRWPRFENGPWQERQNPITEITCRRRAEPAAGVTPAGAIGWPFPANNRT